MTEDHRKNPYCNMYEMICKEGFQILHKKIDLLNQRFFFLFLFIVVVFLREPLLAEIVKRMAAK